VIKFVWLASLFFHREIGEALVVMTVVAVTAERLTRGECLLLSEKD
jgi:hypothetical protein